MPSWFRRTDWVIVCIALTMAVVTVFWCAWALHGPAIAEWMFKGPNIALQASGLWGDSFGAFNALFGALGFTAVFATLLVQGAALKRQQDDQHKQRLESSFFQLLSLLRELRSQITFRHSSGFEKLTNEKYAPPHTATAAIREALIEVEFWLEAMEAGGEVAVSSDDVGETYKEYVHVQNEAALGPFFRVMYTILRRISTDRVLNEREKAEYGNLLRAQLTSDDIALAGYNSLSSVSGDFDDFVKEFKLLRYLPEGERRKRFIRHLGASALAPRND